MEKVYLSTLRDIWFNKSRSAVIVIALIMVVCFPIAFLNVAPNLSTVINQEQDTYNLAHYNIFFDRYVDKSVVENISNYIDEYYQNPENEASNESMPGEVIVEPRRFTGSKYKSSGEADIPKDNWIELDVNAINPDNPPRISQLRIQEGRLPTNLTEIALLESLAEKDGLTTGDTITLYDQTGKTEFEIVGLVNSIEYASYDLSQIGAAFLTIQGFERMIGRGGLDDLVNEVSVYFDYDLTDDELTDISDHIKENLQEDGVNVRLLWFVRETSFRRALLDALNLTNQYMTAASVFIFLVAGVVIFVVTNRYITEQKRKIGALHSFGVTKKSILLSFCLRILILGIIAIVLGLIIAKYLISLIVSQLVEQWGLIGFANSMTLFSIGFTLISSAVVAYGATFLAVLNLMRLTPYEAMRGKSSEMKNRGPLFKFSSVLPTKMLRAAAKNLTRNRTRTLLTVIAFCTALTFAGSLIYTDTALNHTINQFYDEKVHFDVEVDIGYPTLTNPLSTVDEEIFDNPDVERGEYFINSLVEIENRAGNLTYLMGFENPNTSMYDMSSENLLNGRWYNQNSSEMVISKYIEAKYDLEINDTLRYDFFGMQFNSTIVGVTNDLLYNSAIFASFQFINHVLNHELYSSISQELIVANKLLLQLKEGVNVNAFQNEMNENNRKVNIAVTKETYVRRSIALSESQTAIIYLMVFLGLVVGAVSVFTTLLIAVVEREREIGLLRVFGYKNWEVILQLMIEGLIIGVIALIPTFVLSRVISANLWNNIISENLYKVYSYYPLWINGLLSLFALVSITISIIPAFRLAIQNKLSETIREE